MVTGRIYFFDQEDPKKGFLYWLTKGRKHSISDPIQSKKKGNYLQSGDLV